MVLILLALTNKAWHAVSTVPCLGSVAVVTQPNGEQLGKKGFFGLQSQVTSTLCSLIVWGPVNQIVLPTFRVSLYTPVNPIKKNPHKQAHRSTRSSLETLFLCDSV